MSILGYFALFGISLVLILAVFAGALALSVPNVSQLKGCLTTTMNHVRLCPKSPHYVKLSDISKNVVQAVIASEDGNFYHHHGFDWYEIQRSFEKNWEDGHIERGGSTLTQQLAKNVFLSERRTYWRKIKEAYITYSLEKHFSKNFILEKYLNVVELGPHLYGVKDAAEKYFHKSPADLNVLEGVTLAYLLPNPKVYSHVFRAGHLSPFATKIISIILRRLFRYQKISGDEYRFALTQLSAFPWPNLTQADFDHAVQQGAMASLQPTDDPSVTDDDSEATEDKDLQELYQKELEVDQSEEAQDVGTAADTSPDH